MTIEASRALREVLARPKTWPVLLASVVAATFTLFQLWTSYGGTLGSLQQSYAHLGFAMVLIFLTRPALAETSRRAGVRWLIDAPLVAASAVVSLYPRLVGRARAKELFFTARRVEASEALALGIVERVVDAGTHLDVALAVAEEIKVNSSPLGAAAVKRMVNAGADMSIGDASAINDALRRPLEGTKDYEEGIRAFFEKRRPVWRGE